MFSFFFDLKKIQKIQLYLAFWYHSVDKEIQIVEKQNKDLFSRVLEKTHVI